jgi:hypothetical protein
MNDNDPDDRAAFKALLNGMRMKADEENFDEAISQAYRAWQVSEVCQLADVALVIKLMVDAS